MTIRLSSSRRTTLAALGVAVLAACGSDPVAVPPPANLAYATNPAVYTRGAAIAANAPSSTGGAAARYSVTPGLPAGLHLDDNTGVIAGTPALVTAAAGYVVTASNESGSTSASLGIEVRDVPPANLAYWPNPAIYTADMPAREAVPTFSGGDVVLWEVSPALPAGLTLCPVTGIISGIPTATVGRSVHVVTASNSGGVASVEVAITVTEQAPTFLAYGESLASYTQGVAITPNQPVSGGGAPASYAVQPPLPAGLSLDAVTGVIAGTPTALAVRATYVVTATNSGGSVSGSVSIAVNDVPPSGLTYATPVTYAKDVAITPNLPAVSGGSVVTWSISPALPAGLSFDAATGAIAGTPLATSPTTAYVVTASNSGGSTSTVVTITVTSLAQQGQLAVVSDMATSTPFARHILVSGKNFEQLRSVTVEVATKAGGVSRPFRANFSESYLRRRGLILADDKLKLLAVGLYAGETNLVSATLEFADGSAQSFWTVVTADAYVDPTGVYGSPTFIKTRQAGDGLNFGYFWIKGFLGQPVLMDTDGSIRWTSTLSPIRSMSGTFVDGAYLLGNSSQLWRIELDGTASFTALDEPRYQAFHHDMIFGKVGLLAEFDGQGADGSAQIETMLAEIALDGATLKEWSMADIFRREMIAGGDDPSNFVRDGIDWFHMNSAFYVPEDDSLLISSRENFVVKLDYTTGKIKWLLGDPTKHWYVNYPSLRALAVTLTNGLYPIGQHSVSAPAPGELLVFDNGFGSMNYPVGMPAGETRTFSVASRFAIDDATRTARTIWSYDAGRAIYSAVCSSVFETAPGEYVVNYSFLQNPTRSKIVGLAADGTSAFEFDLPNTGCSSSHNVPPVPLTGLDVR